MKYRKIVVTGASGFLGGRTVKALKTQFPTSTIVGTGRRDNRYSEFEALDCEFKVGDLLDKDHCLKLCRDADLLIHCAALSSPWGSYEKFYSANVQSTKNLLEAAKSCRVQKMIFISTPSIYFEHKDRWNVNESMSLPSPLINNYAVTKLEAEKLVLEENNADFQTIALRPRAIIGAEDTVIMPRVLKAYEENKLRLIGNGENVVDLTCVKNVIHAITCCLKADFETFGQAYNITDGQPTKLWEQINYMLTSMGKKPVKKKIPIFVGRAVAMLSEKIAIWRKLDEPTLTDYGIGILARNFTLDISKAKKELNYIPVYTTKDGIDEFVNWYKKSKHG